jgi:cellulose biosynthesis protein BcsQ
MDPSDVYPVFVLFIPLGGGVAVVALLVGMFCGWRLAIRSRPNESDKERDEIKELTTTLCDSLKKNADLERETGELRTSLAKAEVAEDLVRAQLKPLHDNLELVGRECTVWKKLALQLKAKSTTADQIEQLLKELTAQKETVANLTKDLAAERNLHAQTRTQLDNQRQAGEDAVAKAEEMITEQLQNIGASSGKVWERPIPLDAQRFVPLGPERRCPIISLLNLKGGVGKTTLTLNLAATLSDRGKTVLMVDCDHQRSLSLMCLPQRRLTESHGAKHTLQHAFLQPDLSPDAFLACVRQLAQNMPLCSVLVNTAAHDEQEDGLAEVEEQMMFKWVAAPKPHDARLVLRRWLHDRAVSNRFDYVLLDCPPRFSTATINALAASDFVLVPVVLDMVSATNPLTHLLRKLRRLHEPCLFPDFKLLGIVANCVHYHGGKPTGSQPSIWVDLPGPAAGAWGKPPHQFETMISDELIYGRVAKVLHDDSDHAVAVWADANKKPNEQFNKLTDELLERIKSETSHLEPVSP